MNWEKIYLRTNDKELSIYIKRYVGESVSNVLFVGQTFLLWGEGGQTFYVRGGGAYDDVDEEVDVSEANFLVSKASKLSTGARILMGLEILVVT